MQIECGMYRTDAGDIFKVQQAKQSGHCYAKHLRPINGQRLTDVSDVVHFEFVYSPGAINALRSEMRLTLEQAQEFGIKYGVCCVCGAFLKDAVSVATGIGPVCKRRI